MSEGHFNTPREVGYDKKNQEIYHKWISKNESNNIFKGTNQSDLFFFAMAIGRNRDQKQSIKSSAKNIPISAFTSIQEWGILSLAIAEKNDLLVLKDEKPIYEEAEKYAEEGIQIIQAHIIMNCSETIQYKLL